MLTGPPKPATITTRPKRTSRTARHARAKCRTSAGNLPRDTFRNLIVRADYSKQTFKHILAPVWLLTYTYGAKAFQCAINGVTGAIAGEYPKSPWKIALLVIVIFVVVVIAMSLAGR